MNRTSDIGVILWALVSMALISGCVALYIIKENEIEKRILLEKQYREVVKEKDRLVSDMGVLKDTKAALELDLALKQRDLQSAQDRYELLKMEYNLIKESRLRQELAETPQRFREDEKLQEERASLMAELELSKERYLELKGAYEQVQQAKEMLEQKLKNSLDAGVKLETIIVEPAKKPADRAATERPADTAEGEVLAVNKEYEFLVINLGLRNGVTEDSEISVYRNNELIARGQVEKLYENISAVVVDNRVQLNRVRVGDKAIGVVKAMPRR